MRLFPLLLVACAAKDDLPTLEVSPAALDVGVVPVGDVETATLTLMNQGPGIAKIGTITLSDSAALAWSLVRADTTDLFAGATSEIEVAFAPRMARVSETRLVIRSNDPVNRVLDVPLTGTGGKPGFGDGDTGDSGDGQPRGNVGEPTVDDDGDGLAEADGDCDDGDSAVFPGAAEACDGVDGDCSGVVDDLDLDGDGHSTCDAGGDCDDTDPLAYPVLVEAGATGTASGTIAAPFATLEDALDHLDPVCRTVVLLPGAHTASASWTHGSVTVRGAGAAADVQLTPPAGRRAITVGEDGTLALESLTLTGARGTEGDGGALYVEGTARLTDVRAVDNRSSEDGGAIAVHDGSLSLDGCVLEGNVSANDGGALYAWDATITDAGSTWAGNAARVGGAVVVQQSRLTTSDATFSGNTADVSGGALVLRGGDHTVERGLFSDNVAGADGGAVLADDTPSGTVRNLLVVGNRAGGNGGGIAVSGAPRDLLVANNTLVGNDASDAGGGLYAATGCGGDPYAWAACETSLSLISNVVVGSGGRSGVAARATSGGVSVAYTLAWDNAGDAFALDGGTDAGDNDAADPLFDRWSDDGDATNDLFTLAAGSPAIDSGPADGHETWSDPDGSRNDRGYTGGPAAR